MIGFYTVKRFKQLVPDIYLRFLKGTFWVLVGSIIARGSSLFGSILIGRILNVDGFGRLGVVQNTVGLFGVLAGAGLGLAMTKFISEYRNKPERLQTMISAGLQINYVVSAGLALIFFLSASVLANQVLGDQSLVGELRLASVMILFSALNGVQVGVLSGFEDFRSIAISQSVRGILLVTLMVAGALIGHVQGALLGLVLADFASVILNRVFLLRLTRTYGLSLALTGIDTFEYRTLLAFSVPALLASVVTQPAIWIGTVLLTNQPNGYNAVGLFYAADKWRQMVLFVPSAISSVILPMLSNLYSSDQRGYRRIAWLSVLSNVIIVVIAIIILSLVSQQLMEMYGKDFIGGTSTLLVLLWSALFAVTNTVLGQVLVSRGLMWARFWLDLLLATLLLVFSWLLIPIYFQLGFAYATLLAFGVTTCVLITYIAFKGLMRPDSFQAVTMEKE